MSITLVELLRASAQEAQYDLAAGKSVTDPLLIEAADRIEQLEKVLFMLLDDIELGEGPGELALEWARALRGTSGK